MCTSAWSSTLRRLAPAGLLALALPSPSAGQAPTCDSMLLRHARGPQGYRLRGDRCEGIYVQQVAGTTLFVSSLTESFEEYDLTSGDPLKLRWSLPADSALRLQVRSVKRDVYYGMDTRRPRGSRSYEWPTSLLSSQRIRRRDIGVLGWTPYSLGSAQGSVYVPLRIGQRRPPAGQRRYDLVLFPSERLAEVFVTLIRLGASGEPVEFVRRNQPLRLGFYPAERPIVIRIDDLGPPGFYRAEITAILPDSAAVRVQPFWIYHAPPDGPASGLERGGAEVRGGTGEPRWRSARGARGAHLPGRGALAPHRRPAEGHRVTRLRRP